MLSPFQPFQQPSILTDVVDHFTNRLNSYRQFWLIIGIITVGLLDLGLTTFIGLEDLSAMPFVLPINERAHSSAFQCKKFVKEFAKAAKIGQLFMSRSSCNIPAEKA